MERHPIDTPHGEARPEGGGFVGRGQEARRLRKALRAGRSIVVVRGDAGSGTSRLVDEVLGAAEFAEWTQLRGTCSDDAAPVPFEAVTSALAGLPYRPGPPAPLPSVAGVVGLLVPELVDRLPRPPVSAADPEVRRGLLPRAVRALLASLGDAVLVLEDVHHADPATLGLLGHLTHAMPPGLRLVVTEDAAPGLPVLGVRAAGGAHCEEIRVRPWTAADTEEFVRRWAARRSSVRAEELPELAAVVHELSGGLPGAVGALLGDAAGLPGADAPEAADHGGILDAVRKAGVPGRVGREFARRCAPLTEDAWRIVAAAAVLDRPVGPAVLADVAECVPERAEAAADACVRRSVLRTEGPLLSFRSPLDRRAALARVSGPRAARLSLRAPCSP
ncbi:AAA family ATPase [Streptomyces sp. NPDC039028]|uniref:AAA family ATPase n=1 Tax=Streptomyces sp. NPDC039028 TaxID=3155370 RepID=UPI0033EAAFB7